MRVGSVGKLLAAGQSSAHTRGHTRVRSLTSAWCEGETLAPSLLSAHVRGHTQGKSLMRAGNVGVALAISQPS